MCVFCCFLSLYLYFWDYRYWSKRGIPQCQPSFFFGNAGSILFDRKCIAEALEDIYNRTKQHALIGFYLLNKPTLMLNNLEVIKEVCAKSSR